MNNPEANGDDMGAQFITTDGSQVALKGKLTLEVLQKAVGGYIQIITIPKLPTGHDTMVVNEDGISMNLAPNVSASVLSGGHEIFGPAVVCRSSDID